MPLAEDLQVSRQHQRRALGRLGAIDQVASTKSLVLHHIELEPERAASVTEATSSIEQMLMVESVKGTPNSSAARAASISPSACCMPRQAGWRDAPPASTTFWPIIVRFERAVRHVDEYALAQLDLGEIALVRADRSISVQCTGIRIVEEHFRHAALGELLEVSDGERSGHGRDFRIWIVPWPLT